MIFQRKLPKGEAAIGATADGTIPSSSLSVHQQPKPTPQTIHTRISVLLPFPP